MQNAVLIAITNCALFKIVITCVQARGYQTSHSQAPAFRAISMRRVLPFPTLSSFGEGGHGGQKLASTCSDDEINISVITTFERVFTGTWDPDVDMRTARVRRTWPLHGYK